MKPEVVDDIKKKVELIDEEIKKCKDEERKMSLMTIKENILKFMDFKTKVNAA